MARCLGAMKSCLKKNEITKRKFLVSDTKYGTLSIHADYQANTCVHIYHRVAFGYFCKSPENIPQACKKEKKFRLVAEAI